jgi:mRNA interferase RelE/StbE
LNKYSVNILSKAYDALSKIDKSIAKKITDKLAWFSENVEHVKTISLKGNLSGLYKLRVGAYRVVYEIDHERKIITVHKIGHRRDIYK